MDLNEDWTTVPHATARPQRGSNTDLHIHGLVVFLRFLQELLEAAGRHVFCDEYNLRGASGAAVSVFQVCERQTKRGRRA